MAALCTQILGQPALVSDPRFVTNTARNIAREMLHSIIVKPLQRSRPNGVQGWKRPALPRQINDMAQVWNHRSACASTVD